jgi:hypothetical protein
MEVEMKMVKSLLLGTAAGFVAVAGAQAADMPVKAAVQYVKICNLYGDGFYYIPGTDICLKLGGYVRAQFYYDYGQNATATPFFAPNFADTRFGGQADFTMRTRSLISVDTRQQTEYGVLRTYFIIGHTGDSPTAEALYANRGFIQFAGFTFGLAQSFFDFYSAPATSYFATNTEDTGDGGWRVAAFTATFGNGITSTLSAEEPRRTVILPNGLASTAQGTVPTATSTVTNPFVVGLATSAFGTSPNDYATIRMPDIVYNWRIDQTWGGALIGGAVHDASAAYYLNSNAIGLTGVCQPPGLVAGGTPGGVVANVPGAGFNGSATCGHPADKLGWVVTGGLRLNAQGGSYFQAQGSYTEGALRYISHTQFGLSSPAKFGVGNSLAYGFATDGIFGQSGEVELTKAWGVYASWEQVWTKAWKTSLYGGYLAIQYNDNAKALIAAATCGPQNIVAGSAITQSTTAALGTVTAMSNCDPDWAIGYIGSRTQWNVTSQFYMGVDILYTKLYTAFEGTGFYRTNTARPSGVYNIRNEDNIAVTFRIHRDFVP